MDIILEGITGDYNLANFQAIKNFTLSLNNHKATTRNMFVNQATCCTRQGSTLSFRKTDSELSINSILSAESGETVCFCRDCKTIKQASAQKYSSYCIVGAANGDSSLKNTRRLRV